MPAEGTSAPERTTRRQDERTARIDWILDAALELVVAEGIAGLTTPRLAKRLGYTPAAFYRYFESKDGLLLALETRTAERFYSAFFHSLAIQRASVAPLAARSPKVRALSEIALLARTYASVTRAFPTQFRLVTLLLTTDRSWTAGEAGALLREKVMPHVLSVFQTFSAAEEIGALSPGHAGRRAMTAWIAVHGVLATSSMSASHPDLFDVDALLEELLSTLLRGWGAEPEDVDAALAKGGRARRAMKARAR
jgi:AcrR family transcriptional regulator